MYERVIILLALVVLVKSDIYKNCSDSISCAQTNLIKLVNDLDSKSSVSILEDSIVIEKNNEEEAETAKGNEDLFDRLLRYVSSHQIKIKVPSSEMRSIVSEGRKSKLRRFILPLLLVLKLKAAIIIPAALSLISFVAFNGLGASLMALVIAGATAFRSLIDGHHPKVSYEVVPQISAAHLWNRAGIESFPLGQAYHTIA